MKLVRAIGMVVLLLVLGTGASRDARAVIVNFQGLTGDGQGILGHTFVSGGSIAHMAAFYGSNGVAGPYTRLVSPDAFDTATGNEVAFGSTGSPFAAKASAPHGLEGSGITGPLHIALSGFTLDFNNVADLFFTSPTDETRFYRNGSVAILEEVGPGSFNQLASYTNGVFQIDIDYSTGSITNTFNGTREAGSLTIFPETWTGTSFNPVDVAGSTPQGLFGAFSVTTALDVNTAESIPEPGALAILAPALLLLACRRSV
jgi:hypothetical protein